MKNRLSLFLVWILLVACAVSPPENSYAQKTFAVDLAEREIAITAGFNGSNMLIFGAVAEGEVVLIIRGQPEQYRVRKKNRIGGVWLNNEHLDLPKLPNFYVVASSKNAFDNIPYEMTKEQGIGYKYITDEIPITDLHTREFFLSLIKIKETAGLYQTLPQQIDISSSGLFRINVRIPAAVKPGDYTIRALNIVDGKITEAYQTALTVNKVGFGAEIYRAAHEYPNAYGVGAIILSILSGLLANFLFNRRKA